MRTRTTGSPVVCWGVEPICAVLTEHLGMRIAPSTYYEHAARPVAHRPHVVRDAELLEQIRRVHKDNNDGTYGARKVWLQLNREGFPVARCAVERLMRQAGLVGVHKGKSRRTTVPDPAGQRAGDLVGRQFAVLAPDRLWVADITYVSTWSGWVYVLLTWNLTAGWIVTDRHRNHGVRGHVARERGGEVARPGSARTCCRVAGHLDQSGSCPANHRRVFAGAGGVSAGL